MATEALTIEDAYANAKTYQDMCDINVLFLEGVYDHTAYHCGPVDSETVPLLTDLCTLNKLGMYTYCGQPSTNDIMLVARTEKEKEKHENVKVWTCYQQRGFIDGFVLAEHLPALKTYLKEQDGVYYFFDYPDSSTETNIPFVQKKKIHNSIAPYKCFPLARYANLATSGFDITPEMKDHVAATIKDDAWDVEGCCMTEHGCDLQEEIDLHTGECVDPRIFDKCAAIKIVGRDYNSSVSLEKLMIDFFLSRSQ